jgi:serine phosphatase RsbU (regulator of sigma subunit)
MLPVLLCLALLLVVLLVALQLYVLYQHKRALKREQRALADREEVVTFLNRFANSMVTTGDPAHWLRLVASNVAAAIGARALLIYTLKEETTLELAAKVGELPAVTPRHRSSMALTARLLIELAQERVELSASRLGEIALSQRRLFEHALGDGVGQQQDITSCIAVPMAINDITLGIICAVNKPDPAARFSTDDLYLLESLSHQVALGTTLVTMYQEFSEQQRIQQDLRMAADIQKSLLPEHPPPGRRLKIEAINQPARQVSGDFYDFIALDEDTMLVVIADASGKGIPACLLMAMTRSFVRTNAQRYKHDLEGLLRQLNQNLYADTDEPQFITMACCLVDKKDNTIEYARAGHTEMLMRTPRGDFRVVAPEGPALGLLPPEMCPQFDTFSFSWLPGASILLFTDGISEALNPEKEEFGLDRLITTWREQPFDPTIAAKGVIQAVRSFTRGAPQSDDQTLVVLTRTDPEASEPPAPPPLSNSVHNLSATSA